MEEVLKFDYFSKRIIVTGIFACLLLMFNTSVSSTYRENRQLLHLFVRNDEFFRVD